MDESARGTDIGRLSLRYIAKKALKGRQMDAVPSQQ